MRGREERDDELTRFVSARSQDLHHDAFALTANQESAERLVVTVLADLQRQRVDLSRAGAGARLRMVQLAARDNTPTELTARTHVPERFRALTRMSPRQRAVLLLHTVAGYDDRATSRALQLPSRIFEETVRRIPYDELPGTTANSRELRSLLEEFGDLATWPSATATTESVRTAARASRRPWWTYAASVLVLALTATCIVVAQGWHKEWLQTPDGLNHTHGTHFPTYIQGYKLADVRDMTPGIAQDVTTGTVGAVALPCDIVDPTVRLSVQSEASERTEGDSCPNSATRARLTSVKGRASAMVLGGRRHEYPIALYRKIPLGEYPVATKDFEVQHDLTLAAVRKEVAAGDAPSDPDQRPVLTMHGTAAHPNGTFKGTLRLPHFANQLETSLLRAAGLLSPTTTGTFLVHIGQTPPTTTCGEPGPIAADPAPSDNGCSLVDRQVPQVKYQADVLPDADWVTVEITVKNASGPWTLQVVADSYDIDTGSSD